MNRRALLLALLAATAGGAAPNSAWAAEPKQRVVRLGFVGPLSPSTIAFAPFWNRLRELGWIEGQNLVVDRRSAHGQLERLPALMTEALTHRPDVLVTYGTPGAIAAKKATSTVPIVAWAMSDPIGTGLAASLSRPGGNLTGLTTGYAAGVSGKYLELLQDAVPRLSTVAVIVNPDNPMTREVARQLEALAPGRRLKVTAIELRTVQAIARTFEQARRAAQAVVVAGEPFTLEQMGRVTALAAEHRLPAVYLQGEYVRSGGLLSYGPDFDAMWRRGADYVDKILKGARPEDLPIEQPSQFVLAVNVRTAQALGITIPESIMLRASEVIR